MLNKFIKAAALVTAFSIAGCAGYKKESPAPELYRDVAVKAYMPGEKEPIKFKGGEKIVSRTKTETTVTREVPVTLAVSSVEKGQPTLIDNPNRKPGCEQCGIPAKILFTPTKRVNKKETVMKPVVDKTTVTTTTTKEFGEGTAITGFVRDGEGFFDSNKTKTLGAVTAEEDLQGADMTEQTAPSQAAEVGGFLGNLGRFATGVGILDAAIKYEPKADKTNVNTSANSESKAGAVSGSQINVKPGRPDHGGHGHNGDNCDY